MYILQLDKIHMKTVLQNICRSNNLNLEKLMHCRTDLVQGAYEVYMKTKDEPETVETL